MGTTFILLLEVHKQPSLKKTYLSVTLFVYNQTIHLDNRQLIVLTK